MSEWTKKRIQSYMYQPGEWAGRLARDVSAELAAERDNVEQWKVQYQLKSEMFIQVSEQLAAEREHVNELAQHANELADETDGLRKQLDAERLEIKRLKNMISQYAIDAYEH